MPMKQRTAGIVSVLLAGAIMALALLGIADVGWDYDPPLGMILLMFACGVAGALMAFALMYAHWLFKWERFIDEHDQELPRD